MKISANMATIESRRPWLPRCIHSLAKQFDVIRIHCNDYEPTDRQKEMYPNVKWFWGEDYTDNAKFLWVGEDEWYFSCDDDIIYAATYVDDMMERLKDSPKTIFTHHGRILEKDATDYYRSGEMFYYSRAVENEAKLDVCGTGVTAFNSKHFKPDVFQYNEDKMVDMLFGMEAAKAGKTIRCLTHSNKYFHTLPSANKNSIYIDQHRDASVQLEYAKEILKLKE